MQQSKKYGPNHIPSICNHPPLLSLEALIKIFRRLGRIYAGNGAVDFK